MMRIEATCLALVTVFLTGELVLGAQVLGAQADVQVKEGRLNDRIGDRGDRVLDYSYAGYQASEATVPIVPARAVVGVPEIDNTQAIQAAIDYVAALPLDKNGFRGAVLIPPGKYAVSGTLKIRASGVVIRGSGYGSSDANPIANIDGAENATVIVATGKSRRAVFEVIGTPAVVEDKSTEIVDPYVPINATRLTVADASRIEKGQMIRVSHPSTEAWIVALGMNDFGGDRHGPRWRPGSRDLHWFRLVSKVDGSVLTLDAPLTYGLNRTLSVCSVSNVNTESLVRNVGVENLRIEPTYDTDNPKDEEHAWFGVSVNHARDAWVRRVTCANLAGSAVAVWEGASRVTVEDCKCLHPVGEIGGWRRNSFFTCGQQVLMQRLYAEDGRHDFAVGACAAGPNAFVQCEAVRPHAESGTIDSAACGTLFDRVRCDGNSLALRNKMYQSQGVGWTSFNGLLWNCSASVVYIERPPMAQNWGFGTHGEYSGNGAWFNSDDNIQPESLFFAQLAERIGIDRVRDRELLHLPKIQSSRAPTLEAASEAVAATKLPRLTMAQWIDECCSEHPLPISRDGLPQVPTTELGKKENATKRSPGADSTFRIRNGWMTFDDRLAIGQELSVPWWNGGIRPTDVAQAKPALTRFVPGRDGLGYTDDIDEVVSRMKEAGQISLWQHPPLWYDRRRDDHTRVQRMDSDVVAPFYETPWARSGSGTAADGLSCWDLTKTNGWYFDRLRSFASRGSTRGLMLFNGLYMQHSVLEAGAHYVDAPWRPTNNINDIMIPEPVFFAGDKLVYVAEQFYDTKNSQLTELHRRYMTNVLDELGKEPNVVLFLSEEYTGPVGFVELWLDTIREWTASSGVKPIVALYATKDVTDEILSKPHYNELVSLIYNRFGAEGWWIQPDGSLYAPQGGKNLAPRQWNRLLKPKAPGFEQVYMAVREYRMLYPEKPFVYQGPSQHCWANLLGGGSLVPLPRSTNRELLSAIVAMKPLENRIGLSDDRGNMLVYATEPPITTGTIRVVSMDTGETSSEIPRSPEKPVLYWIAQ